MNYRRLNPGEQQRFDDHEKQLGEGIYYLEKAEKSDLDYLITNFIQQSSNKFTNRVTALIQEMHRAQPEIITESIINRFLEHGHAIPRFDTYPRSEFTDICRNFFIVPEDYPDNYFDTDGLGLIFNLPSLLARFWYRGGTNSWGMEGKELPEGQIEWGHLYRESLPIIWEAVGEAECEHDLIFNRINPINVHDPKQYYYLWWVKKRQQLPNDNHRNVADSHSLDMTLDH